MALTHFAALPTAEVRAVQGGGLDANGLPPEHHISDGDGNPCRHCLTEIAAGKPMLILAWRPFPEPQPYAELGPIFLHAERCQRYDAGGEVPPMFLAWERLLLRGYNAAHRIVYGTGRTVATREPPRRPRSSWHGRNSPTCTSARPGNGCYQCRIERG